MATCIVAAIMGASAATLEIDFPSDFSVRRNGGSPGHKPIS